MPRSGYDMGNHTSGSDKRSAGNTGSSSSQKHKQSSSAQKGGKSEGSRTNSHGVPGPGKSGHGYYS